MTVVDGWKTESLGRVAHITMGQSPDSKYYSEEKNGLPFLQGCAEFTSRFPKHAIYCSQTKKVANTGSILFSVRAPVGKINIADRDYIVGRGLAAISGIDVDQTYLEHYLKYVESRFRNASQGSTFEAINSSELNKWSIEYPTSQSEQAKIAQILSTVDRAIEQTEALIAKQQRIKTGLMQDLLTRGIDEHGNLRSEQTHKFKDSPLGRIPVEWEVATLQSMASKDKHSIVDGPFGSNLKMIHYRDSGVPIIQSGFVTRGVFAASNYLYVDESKFKSEIRSKAVPGDIVMAKIGARCGMSSILPDNHPISIIAGNCIKVTVSEENSNKYVLAYLQYKYSITHFEDIISTTAQPAVNMPALKVILLKKPTLTEQLLIVECFEKSQSEIEVQERSLTKFRSLKTALMQDLLTGKKRVNTLMEKILCNHQ
jgi:type I restriction enzyme S subunit